jgi:uncharacterized LabA/DUF88 family protein
MTNLNDKKSVIFKEAKPLKRVNFYYDGFNFYRGLQEAKWRHYYWLDIVAFSKKLIGKYDDWQLNKVNYYTAPPLSEPKRLRQTMLLKANTHKHPGLFEVKYGSYSQRKLTCRGTCKENFYMPEEKGADVGVAVDLVADAILKNCDVTVLISGDNDQIPALKFLKAHNPNHKVLVFFPPHRNRNELHKYSYKQHHLISSMHLFESSLLDHVERFPDGSFCMRPPEWPPVPAPASIIANK